MNIKYSLIFLSVLFPMVACGMTQEQREQAWKLVADARTSVQAGLQAGGAIAAQNEAMSTAVQQLPTTEQVDQFEASSASAMTGQPVVQPVAEQESRLHYILHNPWAWLSAGAAASVAAYFFGKSRSKIEREYIFFPTLE